MLPRTPQQTQLPVRWYTDTDIYTLEQQHIFKHAPQYMGHALMTPNAGDFYAIDWLNNAKSLVNSDGEIRLTSNICRHRQAIMLTGRGNQTNIVCPLHRWTYDLNGKLLGAPQFAQNPCLHLNATPLQQWQGLLFAAPHHITEALLQLGCKHEMDFSGYLFDSAHTSHYPFNWKTFVEAYLEDYHVGPFHPGLNQVVDCNDLSWDFSAHFSAQTVGYKPLNHSNVSPAYQRWQQVIAQYHGNTPPKHGAIWLVYYPFLMIEWYPQVLVVSHLIPTGVDSCTNVVEFYYPEDIALFERDYVAAQQAAYFETALEDQEICQRMHDGRKALAAQGLDEHGPYQQPLEAGLQHFHLWYRQQMEHAISQTTAHTNEATQTR